jgi:serine O-acetyltransferase
MMKDLSMDYLVKPDMDVHQQYVSSDMPDWSRERKRFMEWAPWKSLLASIRAYQLYKRSSNPIARLVLKKIAVLRHIFWSAVTGTDIPLNTTIGGGLMIPHPNGIVIHANAVIGPNCLIFQQVTIGSRVGEAAPVIGGHVDIGAGAKLLGNITIGDNVQIGANSVVLHDIPAGKTAVGIPARLVD